MDIIYTREFVKNFRKLPVAIKRLHQEQETIFRKNWHDPRLQVKKLTDHLQPFSFRVTRTYRVLFVFVGKETVLFATIGHRKDIYR